MADGRKRSHSHNSGLDSSNTTPQPLIQILLIGRTGNGKSTLGNRILRRSSPFFAVSTGIISETTSTELGVGLDYTSQHGSYRIEVVDFPDICEIDNVDKKNEAETCKTLTFPYPTAVCLVVRADIRFTPEEYAVYQDTKILLGSGVLNHNLIVVFTMADRLPDQQRDNFEQQLQKANEELQQVMRDASNRYVLVGRSDLLGNSCHSNRDKQLMDIVVGLHIRQQASSSSSEQCVRAMLLGPKKSGKSATGNTILFPDPRFELKAVTSEESCELAPTTTRLFRLEIVDTTTPDVSSPQEEKDDKIYETEVRKWICTLGRTVDVFLYVVSVGDAKGALENFSERDMDVLRALEKVLQNVAEVHRRLILIFSKADLLEGKGIYLDQQLQKASPVLQSLLIRVSNRYVQMDNTTRNEQQLRLQQNRLFQLVDQVIKGNKGVATKLEQVLVSDRGKNHSLKENPGKSPEEANQGSAKKEKPRSLMKESPGNWLFGFVHRKQETLDNPHCRRRSSSVEVLSVTKHSFGFESTAAERSYPLTPDAGNSQEPKSIEQQTLTSSPNQRLVGTQNQPIADSRQQKAAKAPRYKKKEGGSQTRQTGATANRSTVNTGLQQPQDMHGVSSSQYGNVQGSHHGSPGDTKNKEKNMTSSCIVS